MDTTLPTEVLIQVSEYLNPADLASACCVNRTWFNPFASKLWRSIHKDQFSQEALLDALPRYSVFVRELHCSRFAKLDRLGPECTRLVVMEAPVLGPAPGRRDGWAVEILERNPDLEEVSVWFPNRYEATKQLMRVIGIVVRMKKLRRLYIDGFMAPEWALEYLLEMLPGLEELSIELWQANPDAVLDSDFVAWRMQRMVLQDTGDQDDAGPTSTSSAMAPATSAITLAASLSAEALSSAVTTSTTTATISTAETSTPRQLRRLSLVDIEFSFEYFLRLVQDYPLLESIVLEGSDESAHFRPGESSSFIPFCEQLRILCPRLDQLSLKSVEINNDGLEYLLSAFPRLKRLAIANTPMVDSEILQILLDRPGYSETLEDIELTHDFSTGPSAAATLEVLRRFHRLRRLRVTYGTIMLAPLIQLFNETNDGQQQQQHHQQQQPQQHQQTTSSDNSDDLQSQGQIHATPTRPGEVLEVFDVTIVGPSRDWAPPELLVDEYEDRYEQQEHDADDVDKTYPLSDELDMPGAFKDSFAKNTSYSRSTSATNRDPTPIATAMRSANVVNPHGSAYEVAGPLAGGTSPVHNLALDPVKGQTFSDPVGAPGGTPAHGLAETVKDSAAAVTASAAATGASIIATAKKLISSRDGNENELGDHSQHYNIRPISNINTTTNTTNNPSPASPIASSPRTPSISSTSSPKPLGPHDRSPSKVSIHAHKPSDKATYGNLDSPGANSQPGPLSERTLVSTPLPTPKKTIAGPFGPVMVANWNDHKRQADVSTPTSEDFDSPQLGGPMRSSIAPESAPSAPAAASKGIHAPTPLREEVPPVKKAAAVPIAQPPTALASYFPHAQNSSTMDATPHHSSTMTAPIPHHQDKEPLTERIKETFSHHDHTPTTTAAAATAAAAVPKEPLDERIKEDSRRDPHPTVEIPSKVFTNKTEYVPVGNLKDSDLSKVAQAASHQPIVPETTHKTGTTPTVVKMEPLGEGIKEGFHHEAHPTVEAPTKVNTATMATSSAAPEGSMNRTEHVPGENLKDMDQTNAAQTTSQKPFKRIVTETITAIVRPIVVAKEPLSERIKETFSHHKSHPTPTATTTAVSKEPLGERIKEDFRHDSHPTAEVPIKANTSAIATTSVVPEVFTNKTKDVPVENLKETDLTKVAQAPSRMQPVKTTVTDETTTTTSTTTNNKPMHDKDGESFADRVKEIFQHDNSTPATVHHNKIEHVPTVVEKHHHHDEPTKATIGSITSTAPVVAPVVSHSYEPTKAIATDKSTTPDVEKESLIDRVKDVFHHGDTSKAAPHTTITSSSHESAAPAAVIAATAGTAAGVAAFLNDEETDNTTTPSHVHGHSAYLAPGTKSTIATSEHTPAHEEIKSYVFKPVNVSPLKKTKPVPAPVFDTTYMNTPVHAPMTASTTTPAVVTLSDRPIEHTENTSSPPITATTTAAKVPVVAPVISATIITATKPKANEIHFTNSKTLRPVTEHRTWAIPDQADHRSMGTKIKDAITFHSASEYGPSDPKDLHLSDPKTLKLVERVPAAAVAAAAVVPAVIAPIIHKPTTTATTTGKDAPAQTPVTATTAAKPSTSEIQFTDPKTLRPLTGTRTWDIPAHPDHRSLTTKVKDAIMFHAASEYGPADPKDLHLSDPKTLRLIDHVPIAAAATAGAGAAAVGAPLITKPTTTTTTTAGRDAPARAPVAATTAAKPSTSEIQFTDPKTLRPL
ncbi:hypothetical protein BGZ47_002422, partial [Haplosporangium gracile]